MTARVCLIARLLILAACFTAPAMASDGVVRLAVTTTTDNTGLIEYLIPAFEQTSGITVRVMAGGTGKALRLLVNGDVDIALTHAPSREIPLVEAGTAIDRFEIMHNDFVIVGPQTDPANVSSTDTAAQALAAIARGRQPFISRGDDSGTHDREKHLWMLADTIPSGTWYLQAGQGMAQTLQIAAELGAYTLSDRATWSKFRRSMPLEILFEDRKNLRNIYSVISADPDNSPGMNQAGARSLNRWLRSGDAARLISDFRIDGYRPFIPMATAR